jgi:hypothetical protein
MLNLRTATMILALLSAFLALPGCNHNGPPPAWTGEVVDCGSEVVRKCAPGLLGPVNTCLAKDQDWSPCLLALIPAAACGAEATLACVVRHSGQTAAAGVDDVSVREALHARSFVIERGYRFSDGSGASLEPRRSGARYKAAVGRRARRLCSTPPGANG